VEIGILDGLERGQNLVLHRRQSVSERGEGVNQDGPRNPHSNGGRSEKIPVRGAGGEGRRTVHTFGSGLFGPSSNARGALTCRSSEHAQSKGVEQVRSGSGDCPYLSYCVSKCCERPSLGRIRES